MLMSIIRDEVNIYQIIAYLISSCTVIFFTLPIHEWAHGFAAYKLGDPTPKYQGRLTLNPFAHIDYIGALCILLCGFGWAKPVQINQRNFNKPKLYMAITALAGPFSNLVSAFVALLLLNTLLFFVKSISTVMLLVASFLSFLAYINISLAVFNLIPIPPLDGSRLLSAFLPDRLYYKLMRYEQYIFYAVLALVLFGVLDRPLSYLTSGAYEGILRLASLPFELLA